MVLLKKFSKSVHRLSKIFQPQSIVPKDADIKRNDLTSKSQKLMLELGYIKQSSPGCYHLLPLAVKSLEKLIGLVDYEMGKIGGQKVLLPTLTNTKLWEITGRLETISSELFRVKDRHQHSYILSPTYEEAVSDLIASLSPISYKQLPLKLYQITNKYRDEMKPRFGLLREKQFLMKDMYSFDVSLESARKTYDEICNSYVNILKTIGIDFVQVLGDSGQMGGVLSHEFHYVTNIGEDKIITCLECNYSANLELVKVETNCPKCNSNLVEKNHGIEVGHTFLLAEKYSKPLNTTYLAQNGKPQIVQMGSYGLGLTRILGAALEVLSSEHEMRWPLSLAPYTVLVVPPKEGSREELHLKQVGFSVDNLYALVEKIDSNLSNNVLIDDRNHLTIGRRLLEAKRNGYPFIIVLGKNMVQECPRLELNDLVNNHQANLTQNDLLIYLRDFLENSNKMQTKAFSN